MFNSVIKNNLLLCVCFCLIIWFQGNVYSQNKFNPSKKYAPKALKQDVKILEEVILEMHPVIGIYRSKSYYKQLFSELSESITDSLTEKQFRIKLKLLFDELHCGHTEIWQSKAYVKYIKPVKLNFLPYYVVSLNEKVYVAASINPKKDTLLKSGTEILKINSIPVDSILNYSMHFISGDGYNTTGKEIFMRSGLNYSYPSLFGRPDSFQIESKYKDKVQSYWVNAVNLKDLPYQTFQPKSDSAYRKFRRSNISYGYLDDSKNTSVLKIKSFRSINYKRAYRKYFRRLEKEKTNNLVIDLRYNGGGNLMNSYRLLSYLIDKPQTVTLKTRVKNYPNKKYTRGNIAYKFTRLALNFDGKKKVVGDTVYYTHKIKPSKKHHHNKNIYVLINGGTFSASCIVSAYLKESQKAIFIGSETGGAREGCNAGVTPNYTLPNSKLRVRVPAFRIIHDINPAITGKGILPDYEINYSFIDLLSRKDLELKKVQELIKN